MQMQTKDVSKKALSSTQRSLKQLEQTTQMAGATLEKMHDQVNTSHHALSVLLLSLDLGLAEAAASVCSEARHPKLLEQRSVSASPARASPRSDRQVCSVSLCLAVQAETVLILIMWYLCRPERANAEN